MSEEMICEICKSSETVKDENGIDEIVWTSLMLAGVVLLDAHPACLKKAILAAGELI